MLHAGTGRRLINPELGMPGPGIRIYCDPIVHVESDLMVTALILETTACKLVLIGCDLAVISSALARDVRQAVARSVGTTPSHVLVNYSHTHASPSIKGWGMVDDATQAAAIERYQARLVQAAEQAAEEADRRRQPARLTAGWGEAPLGVYRRETGADGRLILGEVPHAPIDRSVGVIRADDLQGRPIAIVFSYGCHPVIMGPRAQAASSDFPGAARRVVEEVLGGTALFLQACGGNVNPRYGIGFEVDCRDVKDREGTVLAGAVIAAASSKDPLTFVIHLSQPDRILLSTLLDVYIGPSGVTTERLGEAPMGTGPFKFVRWDRNRQVVLERHPDYWRKGLPCVDRLTFRTIPEESVRSQQLRSGQIHLSSSGLLGEMGTLASAGLVLHAPPSGFNLGLYNIHTNTRREPWRRQEVRQALSLAIDREAVGRALFGFVQVLSNPMEANKRFLNPQAASFNRRDLDQAKQLLTAAGFSAGVDGGEAIVCGLGFQFNILGQLVQSQAAEAGIRLRLTILDVGTYVARTLGNRRGEYDIAVCAMVPKPDEYDLLNHPYAKLFTQTLGWIDQRREFYDLLDAARSIPGDGAYRQAITELQRIAMEGQAEIIVGGRLDPTPARAYVKNFVPHTQGNVFLEAVWLDR